jgi:membrane fusion protein, multidrug efflux system
MNKWTLSVLSIVILLFGSVIGFNLYKNKLVADYIANIPEPEYPVTVL